jgi:hypothetical protein
VASLEKIRDIIRAKNLEEEEKAKSIQHSSLSAECSSTKSDSGCCMNPNHQGTIRLPLIDNNFIPFGRLGECQQRYH